MAGNGSLYGGQVKLFTKADNRDNRLDLLIFREAGYRAVLDSIAGVALGDFDRWGESVDYVQAKKCRVEADRLVPVEVDGDLAGEAEVIDFVPGSSKLRVLAPKVKRNSWIEELRAKRLL